MTRTLLKISDTRKHFVLEISDDQMKLFAHAAPREEHAAFTEAECLEEITRVVSLDLIDTGVVRELVKVVREGNEARDRRVAKGTPPVDGRDGRLVWLVRRFDASERENEAGSFKDFFYLGLFENVRRGQKLARVYKPKPGKVGRDALGRDIVPSPGRPATFRTDKSVALVPSLVPDGYDTLVSGLDGYVREELGTISVKEVLEIRGDVDLSTGHIDFIGEVQIGGDLHKGLNVRAGKSIEIRGSVLGDNTIVAGENVTVKGHHQGGDRSALITRGFYAVRTVERLSGEVGTFLHVGIDARECKLRCGAGIEGNSASLVGGSLWCVDGVDVAVLGNEAGVSTTIELRNRGEVTEEFRVLQASIERHGTALAALGLHLGPYTTNRARLALVPQAYRSKLVGWIQQYDRVMGALVELEERRLAISAEPHPRPETLIVARKMLHMGVVLSAEGATLRLVDALPGPVAFGPTPDGATFHSVPVPEPKEKNHEKRKTGRTDR